MYQAAYTAESMAAQIKDPKDRLEAGAKPVIEAAGGTYVAGGFCFGEYDIVILYEAADDTTAAAIALTAGASATAKAAKTTKLLSGSDWIASLQKAQALAPHYHPAR
jgi:uncharacterized protein with GYD domain